MSESIMVGDRVKFTAGRGTSTGRVANVAEGVATIATDGGKTVYRQVKRLERIAAVSAPAEPVTVESADLKPMEDLAGA